MNQRARIILSLATAVLFSSVLQAEEKTVESKIESVGLFKNGLALVDRSVELSEAGTFRIDDMPTPIHGTFFVESATPVTVRTSMELVDAPLNPAKGNLQDQLAGRKVSVLLKDKSGSFEGKVVRIEDKDPPQPVLQVYPGYYGNIQPATSNYLMLDNSQGQLLIDQANIASIQIVGNDSAKVRKPVLHLTLPAAAGQKQIVRITYLASGLAWAPSYRVELLDDKKLAIAQNAVIKNELIDLKDVEVFLISGFPSIGFSNVTSPLALTQNWQAFFSQLSMPVTNGRFTNGGVMQQAVVASNSIGGAGGEMTNIQPGSDDSVDVHYESIDKQSLNVGDAMALDVAAANADYQRVIEWNIPDNRDPDGRYIQDYQRQQNPEKYEDSAWDAVKFKNPLPFAMTSAPATFMKEGKFLGQQTTKWVNKDEENTLRITKALSIRTRSTETEEANNDRQIIYIGGSEYRKSKVNGELTIKNFRKTDGKIIIKREFSGDLISADDKPETKLREEGVWSVNKRSELTWTLDLKAGEEKTIKYSYNVVVRN